MRPKSLFQIFLPQACPICQCFLHSTGLCAKCWQGLVSITKPFCLDCGRPLIYALPETVCASCVIKPFTAQPIRAGFCYDDISKALILPFKHGDRLDIAPIMAQMLLPHFIELSGSVDLVIPVPLHARRYVMRRYNQSAELARWLCAFTQQKQKFAPNLLARTKATSSMAGLTKAQRTKNVSGAFRLSNKSNQRHIMNRHILLIDDVMTTGATIESCAGQLVKSGASRVSALVFARMI